MNYELLISLCSVVVAIITIVVSFFANRQALESAKNLSATQTKTNFFVIYTGRYMELVKTKPDMATCTDAESITFMRQFFNLCSEEFYLHSHGMIDEEVWQMWVEGMRLTMHDMKYKVSWRKLSVIYNEAFWPWFDKEVVNNKSQIG